jgi:ketosteroid isomerase-like protein
MKKSICVLALMFSTVAWAQAPAGGQARGGGGRPNIFAPTATATGPIADVTNAVVTAFNNRDTAYFQKLIAPDAVWLDEDGHHLIALVWMNRLLSANPPRKLTISNLRVQNWTDGGWAGFNYVIEGGANPIKGTNSFVFKKNGNEWQLVLVHGAVDTTVSAH